MELGVSQSLAQSNTKVNITFVKAKSYVSMAESSTSLDVLVSVRVNARRVICSTSWAWGLWGWRHRPWWHRTSSSGISVQAYPTYMFAYSAGGEAAAGEERGGAGWAAVSWFISSVLISLATMQRQVSADPSSWTCPVSVHRQSVDSFLLCGRDVYPQYKLCSWPQWLCRCSPGGEHAATRSSSSRKVVEVPQTQFIDSVFVANRDRDSTGAASWTGRSGVPGSTSTKSSMCQWSCRGEFLCRCGVYGGLWNNSTYFQRARAVHTGKP